MNHASDLLRLALVNSLGFASSFNAPKKHVLNQILICAAVGKLCWSLWKWSGCVCVL